MNRKSKDDKKPVKKAEDNKSDSTDGGNQTNKQQSGSKSDSTNGGNQTNKQTSGSKSDSTGGGNQTNEQPSGSKSDSTGGGNQTNEQPSGSEGSSDEHSKILNAIRDELPDIIKACVSEEVASIKEDLREIQDLNKMLTSQYHEAIGSITSIEEELNSLKDENASLRAFMSEIQDTNNESKEQIQNKEDTNKNQFSTDDDITNLVEKINIHDADESMEFPHDIDNPIASSSKTSTPIASSSQDAEPRGQNVTEVRNEDDEEKPKKPSRNKLRLLNRFELPPGCNLHDPRNTLRYHGPAPGLVELMPNSGVYLTKTGLTRCLRSTDRRELARNLMREIFTDEALEICAMVGEDAIAYDRNNYHTRPGLDENARETILTFAENYRREENWQTTITRKSIRDAMKHFLQNSRK